MPPVHPLPAADRRAFLAVIGRPTVEDSGCVVPQGMSNLEAGATAGNLYPAPGGRIYTVPNLTLRWGLPDDSEFVWLPPGFQYQSVNGGPGAAAMTARGFGPTTIGFKHVLGWNDTWQWTAEVLTTLPSGDSTFGSHGVGGALNAIVSYGNGPLGLALMIGETSQTGPHRRRSAPPEFQSSSGDDVLRAADLAGDLFGEIYAQSHSGYQQGWGNNADGGMQYLATPVSWWTWRRACAFRVPSAGSPTTPAWGSGCCFYGAWPLIGDPIQPSER